MSYGIDVFDSFVEAGEYSGVKRERESEVPSTGSHERGGKKKQSNIDAAASRRKQEESEGYDTFDIEDVPFEVSGDGERVQLNQLSDAFVKAAESAAIERRWTRAFAIYEGKEQVAEVLLQVDKTANRYLTIQQIGVDHAHQKRGVGAEILRALKAACARTSRVAHVQSTTGEGIRSLLRKTFFVPLPYASLDYAWTPPSSVKDEPLTWENWATDVSWAPVVPKRETARFEASVMQMVGFTEDLRGAKTFSRFARWFKPEVNIGVISRRLDVPRKQLEKFRANYCKRCYQASSDFAKKHANCFVVNGWSISAELPIPISHACLCAVLDDGEVFVFDLVRDKEPFYVYGVALRRDFEEALTALNTFCEAGAAEFVIDGLNCLQRDADDEQELRDVLENKVQ